MSIDKLVEPLIRQIIGQSDKMSMGLESIQLVKSKLPTDWHDLRYVIKGYSANFITFYVGKDVNGNLAILKTNGLLGFNLIEIDVNK